MNNVKILLAGPGTGKTTRVKDIIQDNSNVKQILVLSFTNATVNDLLHSFEEAKINIGANDCMTLHKYALKINHLSDFHITNSAEENRLHYYANTLGIDYGQLLTVFKCISFDRMIESCTNFINSNPAYAKDKVGQIGLLIIDEYQDFNEMERDFIEAISQYAKSVVVLGDDDQSIYSFKNAGADGIINLYNLKSTEKIPHENICYRCPDDVVINCNNLMKNNRNRINKILNVFNRQGDIIFEQKTDIVTTNQYIIEQIRTINAKEKDATIMVLSPVHFAVDDLLVEFENEKIPYQNWFSEKIGITELNMFWTLRAIFSPNKIFNIMMLEYEHKSRNKNYLKYLEILKNLIQKGFSNVEAVRQIMEVSHLDKQLCNFINTEPTIEEFSTFYHDMGYAELLRYIQEPSSRQRNLEKLEPLFNPPVKFEPDKINVMSIHKSKGLEADYVFILGLVDGILPNEIQGIDSIEAQRRVLFVGMSRVRKRLYLLSTVWWDGRYVNKVDKSKFKYDYKMKKYCGQTSLFINELKLK